MAWTVSFALLGALLFSLLIAPVLSSFLFGRHVREWHNPVFTAMTKGYRTSLQAAIRFRWLTVAVAAGSLGASILLVTSGWIGSEFLPHLDEGAIWARGTLAPSTGPTEGTRVMDQARLILASFPEVTQVVSQVGRPDDGTDTTGFFYGVFRRSQTAGAMAPGIRKRQRAADLGHGSRAAENPRYPLEFFTAHFRQHGGSGQWSEGPADKIYGDDLKVLEATGDKIVSEMRTVEGITDLGLFRVIGQPNMEFSVDRDRAARYGINVADVQDEIETAVGGKAVTQVLQGEQRCDLVVRYEAPSRNTKEAIENIRIVSPSGERVSLAQLCDIKVRDGASEIYREENSRYVAIKLSVPVRDLGSAVEEAIRKVDQRVKLPPGYHISWLGEYESAKRSSKRLMIVLPMTILVICMILYTMFNSLKWVLLILANVAMPLSEDCWRCC